jgi:hypothetical protein
MNIPSWIFDECEKEGFIIARQAPIIWNKSWNPAYMIYKLILADRKRQKKLQEKKWQKQINKSFRDV